MYIEMTRIAWHSVLFEKMIVVQMVKKILDLCGHEGLLSCSQEPTIEFYL